MTSGRRVFQQHTERTEGSDTTPASHTRKGPVCAERRSRNFGRSKKRSRSPAGPRRLGTATRMSASLFRRLSAFFGSIPGQDPKTAKYAVLTPGPGKFVNVQLISRVVIAPPSEIPLFRRVCPCVRSYWRRRVCTRFRSRKRTWAVCARS